MTFSRLKLPLLASTLALAAAAHAAPVLSEGFDTDAATLASQGWVITNNSAPAGSTTWFVAGEGAVIPAHAGASYIAANYNSGVDGGTVDNWLISPVFSTALAGSVTLWLTGANEGFLDTLKFGFSDGASDTAAFTMGSTVTAPDDWTAYTFAYAAGGAGSTARFAIEYVGEQLALDYVGVDSLSINAVPEPATWALFALGALGLAARRRAVR